jgi:ATP-dependent Clp protease ATP-binding subunit ClpA
MARGDVPVPLADRPLVAVDASTLADLNDASSGRLQQILELNFGAIFFIRGLFNLASAGELWGVMEAMHALEPLLAHGEIQCIATGSPQGLRATPPKRTCWHGISK